MNRPHKTLLLAMLAACAVLLATCGPSPEEIAAFATQTAASWTPTPTGTSTPTPTQTPLPTPQKADHILVRPPAEGLEVIRDNFNVDNNWFPVSDARFSIAMLGNDREGKVTGVTSGYTAEACCYDCALEQEYYLQVDARLDKSVPVSYGLEFSSSGYTSYAFMIDRTQHYYLYKYNGAEWVTFLEQEKSGAIKPYPQSNTLSVYFDKGLIELYANGTLLTTYTDDNPLVSGYTCLVMFGKATGIFDNFFSYEQTPPIFTAGKDSWEVTSYFSGSMLQVQFRNVTGKSMGDADSVLMKNIFNLSVYDSAGKRYPIEHTGGSYSMNFPLDDWSVAVIEFPDVPRTAAGLTLKIPGYDPLPLEPAGALAAACPNGAPAGYWALIVNRSGSGLTDLVIDGVTYKMHNGRNVIFLKAGGTHAILAGGNTINYGGEDCGENTLNIP